MHIVLVKMKLRDQIHFEPFSGTILDSNRF